MVVHHRSVGRKAEGDSSSGGRGTDECRCFLFLSFVLICRLRSHGAKSDVTYFLSLTTTCSCLKIMNPPCVCVNNESPDKYYTKMKKGVELLVLISVFLKTGLHL